MNRRAQTIEHLERSGEDSSLRRALAARLDTAFKRAGISSARAAKWLNVSESEVQFWRQGITVSPLNVFTRIAAFLNLDVYWLCTGHTPGAAAAFEGAA
ncbi:helix-turn-helix transcriptional regulator [Trinickia violacea]|uniref:Helix-turn-helix transcriptional regulator n=1 Tax=Trinickia violacea TaxID=2571746 RepID=A0A4P8IHX2_9BURK|nr:helix-turn-helix transcriptional regulator [Trinickia violacea]QCP48302.1 helix-turn-helix transcriptional regulator [Trinickia violacea]